MVFHLPISLHKCGLRGVGLSQTVEITSDSARPQSAVQLRPLPAR